MRGILLSLLLVSSLTALAGEADSLQQRYDAALSSGTCQEGGIASGAMRTMGASSTMPAHWAATRMLTLIAMAPPIEVPMRKRRSPGWAAEAWVKKSTPQSVRSC